MMSNSLLFVVFYVSFALVAYNSRVPIYAIPNDSERKWRWAITFPINIAVSLIMPVYVYLLYAMKHLVWVFTIFKVPSYVLDQARETDDNHVVTASGRYRAFMLRRFWGTRPTEYAQLVGKSIMWVENPDDATHFARKVDAEGVIRSELIVPGKHIVSAICMNWEKAPRTPGNPNRKVLVCVSGGEKPEDL